MVNIEILSGFFHWFFWKKNLRTKDKKQQS